MNCDNLLKLIYLYAQKSNSDYLTLFELESILKEINIYYLSFIDFYADFDFNVYLFILLDKKWFYVLGNAYVSEEVNFSFEFKKELFTPLTAKFYAQIKESFNAFTQKNKSVLQI